MMLGINAPIKFSILIIVTINISNDNEHKY